MSEQHAAHSFYQDTIPGDGPGRCDYTYGDGSRCGLRPDEHPRVEDLQELIHKLLNRLDANESAWRGADFAWATRTLLTAWEQIRAKDDQIVRLRRRLAKAGEGERDG